MAKVLIVSHYTPSLVNFRGELIRSIVQRGHNVIAVGPERGHEHWIRDLGASFLRIRLHRTGVNPVEDFLTFWDLLCLIKSIRPDVVFSYAIKPVIYGSIAAGLQGISRVYSLITGLGYAFANESLTQKILNRGVVLLYRWAIRYNRVVFFQNRDDLEFFRSLTS